MGLVAYEGAGSAPPFEGLSNLAYCHANSNQHMFRSSVFYFDSMVLDITAMTVIMTGLAISFMSGVNSASCSLSTVTVNVNSPADVQNLTDALACTGGGAFNISWNSSVAIAEKIEVSNSKDVTITGTGSTVVSPASGAGIFSVSGGSTLRLNDLVLAGGSADQGGAVDLLSSSSLFVSDCDFTNNNASNGGEDALHEIGTRYS